MKESGPGYLYGRLHNKKGHRPWEGEIDLTYRCNLSCIHCYCKGSEDKDKELTVQDWKKVLDELHREGCLWLTFTGGEPLVRDDFLEIYSYAKDKGFIITIFTNGQLLSKKIIDYLVKSPPFCIEITLNGITKNTYEAITQTPGSFSQVMKTIQILAKKKLPLMLKANCLKQNKDEITKIKRFTEELLGKPSQNKYCFHVTTLIYPRLNGDKTPCEHRLSFEELLEIKRQNPLIWEAYQKEFCSVLFDLDRYREILYCNVAGRNYFYIDPYGRLKPCRLSGKFSVDLKTASFKEGFYKVFPQIFKERFKTNSKCQRCLLRPICHFCGARAYLETGNEETPVPYYCETARAEYSLHQSLKHSHASK